MACGIANDQLHVLLQNSRNSGRLGLKLFHQMMTQLSVAVYLLVLLLILDLINQANLVSLVQKKLDKLLQVPQILRY